MISSFFPLKKLRRNGKWLVFVAILVFGAFAVYQEFARSATTHTRVNPAREGSIWRRPASEQVAGGDYQPDSGEDSASWRSSYTPQAWKPEFKGQANLHVFEDWCGSSTAQLRNNLHYPLYPHSRTTVQKLAVSPQWTNYGLRIFGYLHPYTDGEFVFAVSSDDNSEFWLSRDDSPLNLQLLSWVGKAGTEWTAPGEFEKYASQTSTPVWLSAQKRYFFEVVHKQNDRGTDHVAVAWHLKHDGLRFMVIESKHISLYTNETALLMSDVAHIPQTAASHTSTLGGPLGVEADMLKDDPRDTFYHVPFIKNKYLQGVLPDCSYKPSYIIKGFPLMRYQGLQFVHMSYIYPNDYTRLTHMETENSCFYHESPYYLERYGFSRYIRLDHQENLEREDRVMDFGFQHNDMLEEEEEGEVRGDAAKPRSKLDDGILRDYGDDYDDYIQKRRRKLFSLNKQGAGGALKNTSDTHPRVYKRKWGRGISLKRGDVSDLRLETKASAVVTSVPDRLREHNERDLALEKRVLPTVRVKQPAARRPVKRRKVRQAVTEARPKQRHSGLSVKKGRPRPEVGGQARAKESPTDPSQQPQVHSERSHTQKPVQGSEDNQVQRPKYIQSRVQDQNDSFPDKATVNQRRSYANRTVALRPAVTGNSTSPPKLQLNQQEEVNQMDLRELEMKLNVPLPLERDSTIHKARMTTKDRVVAREWLDGGGEEQESDRKGEARKENGREDEKDSLWDAGRETEGGEEEEMIYEISPPPVFDPTVNWRQTFQVNHLDLQSLRSDWIDLRCNVSGNLILSSSEAQSLVNAFMEKLNLKHHGRFSLVRVINVEKRADAVQGNRYLLELELKDLNGQLLRLSRYIYVLIRRKRQRAREFMLKRSVPETLLCNPVGLHWNSLATVHFIVPVKNQARWVKQLIVDMETLYRETGDSNFNLIITDYNSTDMDVEKALQASTLPRHQYVKLSGNFERSAGLQAGINLITEDHSIVFLCDLHIHFPPSIIDTIRKHCVEGRMAFAPIVMRLDCGATPRQPRGYWEVNGFGLLGLYKTDLDAAGGMNTREFTDRWGGEDWELLDRLLQSGLEVERIFLRNFFHHYHSKRGMWNRRTQSDSR